MHINYFNVSKIFSKISKNSQKFPKFLISPFIISKTLFNPVLNFQDVTYEVSDVRDEGNLEKEVAFQMFGVF